MTPSRRKEINRLADDIREALELDVPVDPERAVDMLGGEVRINGGMRRGLDGKITRDGERFVIELAPQSANRRRFSVAHELGHLFIHMGYLDDAQWEQAETYEDLAYYRSTDNDGGEEREYEAHEFAGAFLMPAEAFKAVAAKHLSRGRYQVDRIAAHFDVSVQAARTRGQWLGLFAW